MEIYAIFPMGMAWWRPSWDTMRPFGCPTDRMTMCPKRLKTRGVLVRPTDQMTMRLKRLKTRGVLVRLELRYKGLKTLVMRPAWSRK